MVAVVVAAEVFDRVEVEVVVETEDDVYLYQQKQLSTITLYKLFEVIEEMDEIRVLRLIFHNLIQVEVEVEVVVDE